jgi:23S rRNA (cytosine1962-C5)-methyltransferase
MAILQLKSGREKSLLRRHPWVFSGAISRLIEDGVPVVAGETVQIVDSHGTFLASGAYSPLSQIRARIWTWNPDQKVDNGFLGRQLEKAFNYRNSFISPESTNAFRLVHAESDGIPGLIADRYGDLVVLQFLSTGVEYWRNTLISLIAEMGNWKAIYERSDSDVRALESLPLRVGILKGSLPENRLTIYEKDTEFFVNIEKGHKTGFYLDQRDNRAFIRNLVKSRSVLDCFAYTGGFTLAALKGEARTVASLDSSSEALDLARENLRLNGFKPEMVEWIQADAFQGLRKLRDHDRKFDLIILDPPKFAPTAAQAQRAARGYKDINLLAFKLLNSGGILITFSCSGGISEDLFQKIVAGAALDAGVDARIMYRFHQAPDHPVAFSFPEGAYLKGFAIQVS